MRLTAKTKDYCIIDDLLRCDLFQDLREFVSSQPHHSVPLRSAAKGTPATYDMPAMRAAAYYGGTCGSMTPIRRLPTGTPIDGFVAGLMTAVTEAAEVVGSQSINWTGFSITPWALPTGAAFHVHVDGPESYTGGFVYFLVKDWPVDYGGLLLIVEPPPYESSRLSLAIHPVENRLVFLSPSVSHAVTRVDPSAGSFLRRTLVGFFG
jgi:hypothetical protein